MFKLFRRKKPKRSGGVKFKAAARFNTYLPPSKQKKATTKRKWL